jgi:predicted DsbA family dithiol-disulfide isomerase
MSRALAIDLVTDVVCPWCYVGTHRLDRVVAALSAERPDLTITIHHHPFELMPGTPREGTNVPDMLRKKYGQAPEKMWARVQEAAAESGLALDLSRQPMSYPTMPAHTLVRLGRENGSEHAIQRALFVAYFDEAKDIADPDVLAAIGRAHGLDPDRVRAFVTDERELALTRNEATIWQQHGVTGVPFFVLAEKLAFSGAQTEDVIRQVIDKALALPVERPE